MDKRQKILLFGAIGVFLVLVALIIVLIVNNYQSNKERDEMTALADSLRGTSALMAGENAQTDLAVEKDIIDLDAEYERLKELGYVQSIQNDSILMQYNEAMAQLEALQKQLQNEKNSNNANQNKIRELEKEISTLKDIAKHYLEEIRRLGEENEALKRDNAAKDEEISSLREEKRVVSESNDRNAQTVRIAKRLIVTSASLQGYKKSDSSKAEKKLSAKKSKVLGVQFTVGPNDVADAGKKTFYIRIISPEGTLLGNGPSFSYNGESLGSTVSATEDYNNEQKVYNIYWTVDTTLTAGDYKVEIFNDGDRLYSGTFAMEK